MMYSQKIRYPIKQELVFGDICGQTIPNISIKSDNFLDYMPIVYQN